MKSGPASTATAGTDQRGAITSADERSRRPDASPTRRGHHQASTAPSMKNSPWATLTTRMTPNTSDRPKAVSASTAAVHQAFQRGQKQVGSEIHGGSVANVLGRMTVEGRTGRAQEIPAF